MSRAVLLTRLEGLTRSKDELLKKLQAIHQLELKIEARIIAGFQPVFDMKTGNVLSRENIKWRIAELAGELIHDPWINYPVLVGVMNGALPFVKELYDRLLEQGYPCQIDALQASSYDGITSGELTVNSILKVPVGWRDVIVIDDVCDTGKTAKKIMELFLQLGAKSVKLMVLVNKEQVRLDNAVHPDFVGFTVSKDAFIAGWGMDYEELLRGYMHGITVVDPQTLPRGGELKFFKSKAFLNEQLQKNIAEIADVEKQLLHYQAEEGPGQQVGAQAVEDSVEDVFLEFISAGPLLGTPLTQQSVNAPVGEEPLSIGTSRGTMFAAAGKPRSHHQRKMSTGGSLEDTEEDGTLHARLYSQ